MENIRRRYFGIRVTSEMLIAVLRSVSGVLFILFLLGGVRVDCFAQTVSVAQIGGVIKDSSGASIAGAQIKITQIETKQERQITSDDQGRYVAPALPVGPYQIEVTASGFKTYLQSGIILQVGNNVDVNIAMQLGALAERIDVTASANMVETKENAISQVIDGRRIVELPLNGRQATQLILLTAGAVANPGIGGDVTGSKSFVTSVAISVAGGQGNGVNYLLDGGDNNDYMTNVNLPIPFPDALQEFSVQTSGLPARFGLHPAGVVNAVTKSGTNGLHGSLFEFLRNGDVNARNFFAPVHDSLKRNQFGGTLGGPILKDKLFVFGGFQGTFNRQNPPASVAFVPTPEVLKGDFSIIDGPSCIAGGKGKVLIDPLTGQPFQGNQIPVQRFDPAALALVTKYLPAAQNSCGRVTYGVPSTGDDDQGVIRMDWLQSSKNSIFGRYFVEDYRNPQIFDGKNILATGSFGQLERAQSATIGDTYTISPTTLNSAHVTFSRRTDNRGPASNVINPNTLGINIPTPVPNLLNTTVTGYFTAIPGAPGVFNVNTFSFSDDIDIVRGKHQIAFGGILLRDQFNISFTTGQNGNFTFNGEYASGKNINDALAAFMLGAMNDFRQDGQTVQEPRGWVLGFYAQDSIRLNTRLTMNIGLRWEPGIPAADKLGQVEAFSQAAFNAGTRSTVFTNAPPGLRFLGDTGLPNNGQNKRLNLFSPRLGLVWDPTGSGRQTVRVSAAIMRDTEELLYNANVPSNPPYATIIARTDPFLAGGTYSNPWGGFPGGVPFPLPSPIPSTYNFPTGGVYVVRIPEFKPTYMAQWSVSYQRQITPNWLTTISYLGTKSTNIWAATALNPAIYIPGSSLSTNARRTLTLQNPTFGAAYGSVTESDPNGNANFNGLLVTVQHRFSSGFTWLTNYTWSHCLSDADTVNGSLFTPTYEQPNNRAADYGNCLFDIRHNMNTSFVAVSPLKGKSIIGRIFGQWQISPIVSLRSGLPINISTGTDVSQTGNNLDRPNVVLPNGYGTTSNPLQYLNPAAFKTQAPGTFGNLGRNVFIGPGAINFDVSLTRTFVIKERWQLTPRFEAFNVINHPNFANPNGNLSSPQFGQITGAAASGFSSGTIGGAAGDPRILQFALKLQF